MSPEEIRLKIVLALIEEGPVDKATLIAAAKLITAFVLGETAPDDA